MNKPTFTALSAVLLISLFFGAAIIYQSCSKKKAEEKSAEELQKDLENLADEYTPGAYFEEGAESEAGDTSFEPDYSNTETTKAVASPAKKANTINSGSKSTSSSGTSSSGSRNGAFLVVAGNYLIETNADEMVSRLKGLGFSSAEKAVFDLSQYYSVIVGRYETRAAADKVSDQVNAKGVDNYVLRQK